VEAAATVQDPADGVFYEGREDFRVNVERSHLWPE
jgi:hypothetical protein